MPVTSTAPDPIPATTARHAIVRCTSCQTLNRVDLARIGDKPKCSRCANALPFDRPLVATDADFQRYLDGAVVPVLVDFYADWCGPCKAMAPMLDALARQRAGNVLVLKLDTDANPITARRFNITSIPTLIVFRAGKESKRQIGVPPRPVLEAMVT
ncbi:MAG: thioredoxin [Gemmatimonadaceae bacterium]